jgi:hypothetical protein
MKPAGNIGTVATKALSLLPKNAIRETKGRNAPQVEAAKRFAAENKVDPRALEVDISSQESVDAASHTL